MPATRMPRMGLGPFADIETDEAVPLAREPDIDLEGISPESLRKAATVLARVEVADAVSEALRADGRSLRDIGQVAGMEAADLSRLAHGRKGTTATSLALLALALGKSLRISIE